MPGRPNIIYILADDLGIGDVRRFNPGRGKIKTPLLDQLAREGAKAEIQGKSIYFLR